jgi:shikimate kinase
MSAADVPLARLRRLGSEKPCGTSVTEVSRLTPGHGREGRMMTERHVALVGFMGAGKSALAREAAERTGRPCVDVDAKLEERLGSIPAYFAAHGEAAFRAVEAEATAEALGRTAPSVISLGGGAVTSAATRDLLAERAVTVWLDVDVDTCWQRVRGSDRPLAQTFDAQLALDISRHREADRARFLGKDDCHRIGFFRDTNGGPMARAQLRRKHWIHRQRQKTGSRGDAVPLHNDGSVMQGSAGTKHGCEQVVRQARIERHPAFDVSA